MRFVLGFKSVSWHDTVLLVYARLRREFLISFKPRYVLKQLQERKGKCNACSCCSCLNLTPFSCSFFDKKTNTCKTWNNLPVSCYVFPLDEKEIELTKKVKSFNCGFYWGKKE